MQALLCVTKEKDWIGQLGSVFPELDLNIHVTQEFDEPVSAESLDRWRAVLLDLDALTGTPGQVCNLTRKLASFGKPVLAIVPVSLLGLVTDLRKAGVYILHKPASAGEIGLALGRVLKR